MKHIQLIENQVNRIITGVLMLTGSLNQHLKLTLKVLNYNRRFLSKSILCSANSFFIIPKKCGTCDVSVDLYVYET